MTWEGDGDGGDKSGLEYEMECLSCFSSDARELVCLVMIGGELGKRRPEKCLGFESGRPLREH
jgi:hypothetical protein